MEVLGVRVLLGPSTTALALAFVGGGVLFGTLSGLTPGLHVNTLAVVMAGLAPVVPAPPHLLAVSMVAAGVTHSFLDVVPMLAIGVPDAALAVTALPGHRLVLGGRGREALRVSAVGSLSAVGVAVVLGVPVTLGMSAVAAPLERVFPLVVALVAFVLLATERDRVAVLGGALSLLASGVLGLLLLDVTTGGVLPGGDTLLPLLSGLFGVPVLVFAYRGAGVPVQTDATVAMAAERSVGWGVLGSVAGALVAYLPGVSAAVAAALAFPFLPADAGDRAFVATVSGVNTANTVFALFALVALGSPRTGVLVAVEDARLPVNLPLVLAAVAIAASVAFVLVPVLGDPYLRVVGRVDPRALAIGVAGLLVALVWGFTGWRGVGILGVATVVGLLPLWFDARRVHLMGVLLVPVGLRGVL
ncbi:MAG: tripartite tricarboxylate transporter permease [Halanaeroarchaeum sp.]